MGGYYYTTKFGDMWDYIAWMVYGDSYMVPVLYAANPTYLQTYLFPDGCQVWCPAVDETEDAVDGIPDWRYEEDEVDTGEDAEDDEDEDEEDEDAE